MQLTQQFLGVALWKEMEAVNQEEGYKFMVTQQQTGIRRQVTKLRNDFAVRDWKNGVMEVFMGML